jgi:hypothetical protein
MTRIEDFSQSTQDMVNRNINRPFPDVEPKLERWFDDSGGLTENRLIFFENYWKEREQLTLIRAKITKESYHRQAIYRDIN